MISKSNIQQQARNTWLTGLGLYGKANEVLNGRLDHLKSRANGLMDELLHKGEHLETELKHKYIEDNPLDVRLKQVREKLGLQSDTESRLSELSDKVDGLLAEVEKLAKSKAPEKIEAAAPKTSTRRKTSTDA